MQTIDSLISESRNKYGDKAALRHKVAGVWKEVSYNALWELSDRIASGLIQKGFKSGEHAALLAPSSPQWVAAYLGILKAGGVVIPIDMELKSSELGHILTNSDTRIIFSSLSCLELIIVLSPDITTLKQIVIFPPVSHAIDSQASQALEALLKEWRDLVTAFRLPPDRTQPIEKLAHQVHLQLRGSILPVCESPGPYDPFSPFESGQTRLTNDVIMQELEAFCHSAPLSAKTRKPHDTAVILYTSGTTGRSKGAMLSHANIISNIQGAIKHFGLDDSIHTLSFLPINHVFEQVCGVLLPLALGGTISFCESLRKLGENLSEVKPTFLLGVPAVYRMLLDRIMKNIGSRRLSRFLFSLPLTRPLITSKVRRTFGSGTIFISGGAALDPAIAQGMTRLGLTIYQGYGITETSPIISAEHPGAQRIGTVGHVLQGVSVRIDNPDAEHVGEILVKGPNVMQGYYKNLAAGAEALENGWYRTGDLGWLDDDGFLTICGRVKNLIVTPNGKNVYPEEVENELMKRPAIAEVMVYGHRIGSSVEEVHAIIYPDQEALDDHCRTLGTGPMSEQEVEALLRTEIQSACAGLADYKRVRRFTIRDDEFPKTTTRKIKRYAVEAGLSTGEDT